MSSENKYPRVLFLGTHGQHNIGDELLLETFLDQFGPDFHYVINTYDLEFTAAQLRDRYVFDLIHTAGDRFALLKHLLRADLVVFGGGSIIKELYASTGRNRYATLLMILSVVLFARWVARRPVAMLNIGVGPLTTSTGRLLARLILRQVDLITVRDPGSFAMCRSLGIDDNGLQEGTDAVFSTHPEWLLGRPSPQGPARSQGPLRIGLNLNRDIENPDNWDHFTSQLAEALSRLRRSRTVEIHAIPMQSQFKEDDDARILTDFARRLPEITFIHHQPTTHEDVAQVISNCDLVIGERLHALVVASILGVPTFVLAYDVKVRELSSMLGLGEYTVDINSPFPVDAIEVPLREMIDDLGAARQQARLRSSELARRARNDFARARRWMAEAAAS